MRVTPNPVALSQRIYSAILFLYPVSLRRQFEKEMIEVFTEQMQDAWEQEGWLGGLSVWRCVGSETLRTAFSSHLQTIGISFVSSLAALAFMCSILMIANAPR